MSTHLWLEMSLHGALHAYLRKEGFYGWGNIPADSVGDGYAGHDGNTHCSDPTGNEVARIAARYPPYHYSVPDLGTTKRDFAHSGLVAPVA